MERLSFVKTEQSFMAYKLSTSSSLLMIIVMTMMIKLKGAELRFSQTAPCSAEGIGCSVALI
jgi:hypothetical protein